MLRGKRVDLRKDPNTVCSLNSAQSVSQSQTQSCVGLVRDQPKVKLEDITELKKIIDLRRSHTKQRFKNKQSDF